jgi:cellulose synthase (UDP-forming)
MSRYRENRAQADVFEQRLRALSPERLPHIDVWIATYDESWQILEKSIVGALNLDYPKEKLHIWVLDDKHRAWLGKCCAELGVHHVTRPDNKGRKAGNHNHALAKTSAPFILSLDADFVPFPNFIYRTLGFFVDPRVAVLQTPQTYYNVDAVRSGLGLQHTAPDELAFFYREMQPARDAWDAAFYCGSCALLRRSALEAVGGFVTATDIEDQATAVRLLAAGYCTRYLNETLSVGLSAESVAVLHDQRKRWCRGSIQIAFMPFGPFGRGLKLVHRLMFSMTSWLSNSICPITFSLAPFTLWGLELFPTELDRRVVGDSHRAESLRVCGLQHHCHGGKDAGPVIAGLEGSLDGGRSRRQFGPRGGRAFRGEREHRDPLGAAVACRG